MLLLITGMPDRRQRWKHTRHAGSHKQQQGGPPAASG